MCVFGAILPLQTPHPLHGPKYAARGLDTDCVFFEADVTARLKPNLCASTTGYHLCGRAHSLTKLRSIYGPEEQVLLRHTDSLSGNAGGGEEKQKVCAFVCEDGWRQTTTTGYNRSGKPLNI